MCSECLHLCILQHNGYICYCNEPNCNKDEQCTCNNDQSSSTSTSTANPDNGLKCQVCQLEDHMCDGESDNGKSMTCLEGEVCVKLEQGMTWKQNKSNLLFMKLQFRIWWWF